MENQPTEEPRFTIRNEWRFVLILIGLFFLMAPLLFPQPEFSQEQTMQDFLSETQRIGIPTNEFDGLLTRVKSDINKNDIKIRVLIGPYFQRFMIYGVLLSPGSSDTDQTYLILIDSDFYNKLNPQEQYALVAHEAGHIAQLFPSGPDFKFLIKAQMDADTFATKYVDPRDFLTFLEKLFSEPTMPRDDIEHTIRRNNIEHLIKPC